MDWNEAIFEREISKGQTGFRSGLGAREEMFNIRAVAGDLLLMITSCLYACVVGSASVCLNVRCE